MNQNIFLKLNSYLSLQIQMLKDLFSDQLYIQSKLFIAAMPQSLRERDMVLPLYQIYSNDRITRDLIVCD